YPMPGETAACDATQTMDLKNVPLNGGFLCSQTSRPFGGPYLRGGARRTANPTGIFLDRLMNSGIGVVLCSEIAGVEIGSHVRAHPQVHQEYMIVPRLGMMDVIEKDPKLNWSVYLGAAGMTG
ncbi:hypothetical protein B0H13DRAFT_1513530, partial [Mycena leptocephala]